MKVRATRLGFWGKKRVYEGEVFDVEEKQFSKRWMEKVVPGEEKPAKPVVAKPSDKDKSPI
jgi:hypothetical protein